VLDDVHRNRAWREAQRDDGAFISDYARDFPQREDLAESFGPWFALRHVPDRLTTQERWTIATTMPNRLAYFDEQGFDMEPYTLAPPIAISHDGNTSASNRSGFEACVR